MNGSSLSGNLSFTITVEIAAERNNASGENGHVQEQGHVWFNQNGNANCNDSSVDTGLLDTNQMTDGHVNIVDANNISVHIDTIHEGTFGHVDDFNLGTFCDQFSFLDLNPIGDPSSIQLPIGAENIDNLNDPYGLETTGMDQVQQDLNVFDGFNDFTFENHNSTFDMHLDWSFLF